jgi:hypothetical protein
MHPQNRNRGRCFAANILRLMGHIPLSVRLQCDHNWNIVGGRYRRRRANKISLGYQFLGRRIPIEKKWLRTSPIAIFFARYDYFGSPPSSLTTMVGGIAPSMELFRIREKSVHPLPSRLSGSELEGSAPISAFCLSHSGD